MRYPVVCVVVAVSAVCFGCGSASPRYTSKSQQHDAENAGYQLSGTASYYAGEFDGRKTANGETYDMNALTAAHRTLPFNTRVRVRNLNNNREVVVRINDRGPFKDNRVIDLSLGAATEIGMISSGTAPVELEIIDGMGGESPDE